MSGETGEPVAGARVIVGGRTYETDDTGVVPANDARPGDNIDVVAESYLDRQTLFRGPAEGRISLWPSTSSTGLRPDLTERLVYTGYGEDAVPGQIALARPPLGVPIYLYVEPAMGDERVRRVVEGAVSAFQEALPDRVLIQATSTPPLRGLVWQVAVDPDATSSEFAGIVFLRYEGNEIVGAKLAFRTLAYLTDDGRLLTHMMGNAFGLRSSDDPDDRMFYEWWRRNPGDFSPKEALVMRLMLERRAGNRWPDNDRSLGATPLHSQAATTIRTHRYEARPD